VPEEVSDSWSSKLSKKTWTSKKKKLTPSNMGVSWGIMKEQGGTHMTLHSWSPEQAVRFLTLKEVLELAASGYLKSAPVAILPDSSLRPTVRA
jgi:hypothetical protein